MIGDPFWTFERTGWGAVYHLLPPDPGKDAPDDHYFCGRLRDDPIGFGTEDPLPWPPHGCQSCLRAYLAWKRRSA